MKIEILGSGCLKCTQLYELVQDAAKELGLTPETSKVQDFKEIMKYGVMTTPALVVNGTVKVYGRIPSKDEVKSYLK
jgi:small redox-active disulfide protein 2